MHGAEQAAGLVVADLKAALKGRDGDGLQSEGVFDGFAVELAGGYLSSPRFQRGRTV